MKRIRELIEEIKKRYPDDNFFADFERRCQDDLIRKHYDAYNKALMTLDNESWKILKKKTIKQFPNQRPGQEKQAFFNTLNESFAYRYLVNKRFENVSIVAEEGKTTPDIKYSIKGNIYHCEVKTIGISEEEIERREKSPYSIDDTVYERLDGKFFNKLSNTINSAKQQLSASETNDLIFIIIDFDDPFQINYSTYKEQLIKFCENQKYEELILKLGLFDNEITFIG